MEILENVDDDGRKRIKVGIPAKEAKKERSGQKPRFTVWFIRKQVRLIGRMAWHRLLLPYSKARIHGPGSSPVKMDPPNSFASRDPR